MTDDKVITAVIELGLKVDGYAVKVDQLAARLAALESPDGAGFPKAESPVSPQIKRPNAPATARQIQFLRRLGYNRPTDGLSVARASELIDSLKSQEAGTS